MQNFLEHFPVVTALVLVVAVVGGVIAVVNPDSLSFKDYCEHLGIFAAGAGVLGIGRGLSKRP